MSTKKSKYPPRWLVAVHEAGHWGVGSELGYPVAEVNILEAPGQDGVCWLRGLSLYTPSLKERLDYEAYCLAGYEAERRVTRATVAAQLIAYGRSSDYLEALDRAVQVHGWAPEPLRGRLVWGELEAARVIARKILASRWGRVEALARGLLDRAQLSAQEAGLCFVQGVAL